MIRRYRHPSSISRASANENFSSSTRARSSRIKSRPCALLLSALNSHWAFVLTRALVPRLFSGSALVHLNSPPLLVSPVTMSGSSESTPSLHLLLFFLLFYFTLALFLHRFLPSLVPFLRVIPRAPLLCPLLYNQTKTKPKPKPKPPTCSFSHCAAMGVGDARLIRADPASSSAPRGYVAPEGDARLIRVVVPLVSTSSHAMGNALGDTRMIRDHPAASSASPGCGVAGVHARMFRADSSASPISSQAKHDTLGEARLFRADLSVSSHRYATPTHVYIPRCLRRFGHCRPPRTPGAWYFLGALWYHWFCATDPYRLLGHLFRRCHWPFGPC